MSYPRKEYNPDQPKKYWSLAEAKVRIASFCAYQERYQQEVRNKLHKRGIYGEEAEELIAYMISEGYLNEERFAQAFVSGKFRIKKWGRNKILQELKFRQISPNCIKSGMKEIDEDEYWETLLHLVEKKADLIKESDDFKKRYKTHQYLMGRGFENDLIQNAIETIFSK
ncbi:regulatory protein RecX [Aquiflexum lacus]|uniref:regulatory protein RecX n=1 Tax=Aquiflexum lacus TaxID=2483805 RepID=UPI001893E010|nr:regulatory protein RecX [Aquiflexum lacus]